MSDKSYKEVLVLYEGVPPDYYKNTDNFRYYLLDVDGSEHSQYSLILGMRYDGLIFDTFNVEEVLLSKCMSRIRPSYSHINPPVVRTDKF